MVCCYMEATEAVQNSDSETVVGVIIQDLREVHTFSENLILTSMIGVHTVTLKEELIYNITTAKRASHLSGDI